jgi:hypothetical protein
VTAEQVREVVNKYVNDQAMTIIVVAPAKLVQAQLERLGPVEVVPMPGKRDSATATATTQPAPASQPAKKAA